MMRKVWQTRLHIVHIFTHHNRHIYHYRVGIISLNTHINLLPTIKRREYRYMRARCVWQRAHDGRRRWWEYWWHKVTEKGQLMGSLGIETDALKFDAWWWITDVWWRWLQFESHGQLHQSLFQFHAKFTWGWARSCPVTTEICHVNQTQVRRPSMFVQWLQHFFWRPILRFWLCKPARTHPIRSSVYLCYNRCNGKWDRDARSGKMHDLLWCAHPQVIKLQSWSLAFYRCLFLPPSYSDTSFLVIESSRRIQSSRHIQSKQ
jgi:hypothetical protein